MDKQSLRQELELLFEQKFATQGFELVEVICRQDGAHLFLCILADRLGGGINLDECAQLSRQISQELDEKNIIASRYILEVSSPGLDRLLKKERDFLRFLNKEAVFFLNDLVSGKCQWQGIISKVDQATVYLQVSGQVLEIPLIKINKAQLVI